MTYLEDARICRNSLQLNSVYKRLTQRNVLDTREVKTVYIVPDYGRT